MAKDTINATEFGETLTKHQAENLLVQVADSLDQANTARQELADANVAHATAFAAMESQLNAVHAQAITSLQTGHTTQLETLRVEHETQLEALRVQVATANERVVIREAELQAVHQAEVAALNMTISALNATIEEQKQLIDVLGGTELGQIMKKEQLRAEKIQRKKDAEAAIAAIDEELISLEG